MWGLMLKDLLNLKKQGQLFIVLLLVYGGLAVFSDMPELFSVFIMIGAIIPTTAEAFDERAHWDRLVLSLPVSKKMIVGSKYLLGVGMSLIGMGLYIGVGAVQSAAFGEVVGSAVLIYALSVLVLALLMPLLFKFGSEKLRLIMIIVVLIPVVGFAALADHIQVPEIAPGQVAPLIAAAVAGVLCLLAVSFFVSVGIVSRKEF